VAEPDPHEAREASTGARQWSHKAPRSQRGPHVCLGRARKGGEREERGQYEWYRPATSVKHPAASVVSSTEGGSAARERSDQGHERQRPKK
jgi:hypothetical protein